MKTSITRLRQPIFSLKFGLENLQNPVIYLTEPRIRTRTEQKNTTCRVKVYIADLNRSMES